MKFNLMSVFLFLMFVSCQTQVDEIDSLLAEDIRSDVERGKNIRIVYSDSSIVKLVIHAPVMERYNDFGNSKDVFPKGILMEFLNPDKIVYSWLKAETAIREQRTQKITAKGNVIFYNDKNEKLETPELIWDERERIVFTDKLVRITQEEKGDTTYGFGFRANQDFTRFEIRKKVQGKLNVSDFITAID